MVEFRISGVPLAPRRPGRLGEAIDGPVEPLADQRQFQEIGDGDAGKTKLSGRDKPPAI